MEEILLLKQYLNGLSTAETIELLEGYGASWLTNTVCQLLTALLLTDASFTTTILPKIQDIIIKIKQIINERESHQKMNEGNAYKVYYQTQT